MFRDRKKLIAALVVGALILVLLAYKTACTPQMDSELAQFLKA